MGKPLSKKRRTVIKVFLQDSKKVNCFYNWLHTYETSHERDISWLHFLTKKLNKHYFKKYGIYPTSEKELELYYAHAESS